VIYFGCFAAHLWWLTGEKWAWLLLSVSRRDARGCAQRAECSGGPKCGRESRCCGEFSTAGREEYPAVRQSVSVPG
jgi:hypothetical protein